MGTESNQWIKWCFNSVWAPLRWNFEADVLFVPTCKAYYRMTHHPITSKLLRRLEPTHEKWFIQTIHRCKPCLFNFYIQRVLDVTMLGRGSYSRKRLDMTMAMAVDCVFKQQIKLIHVQRLVRVTPIKLLVVYMYILFILWTLWFRYVRLWEKKQVDIYFS